MRLPHDLDVLLTETTSPAPITALERLAISQILAISPSEVTRANVDQVSSDLAARRR